jgi:hypothetical protein
VESQWISGGREFALEIKLWVDPFTPLIPASHLHPGGINRILATRSSLDFDVNVRTHEAGYGIGNTAFVIDDGRKGIGP